ncbi:hypothetical protein MUK42_35579 [Musa troglodytarum]|uniref:Beta-adaptin-like protein n=1 Tax=Musa troglodytarum TaxID=320322 RepID=A0A9E7EH07_9LILI|nr:hypothetical protein MUK42_35579 [Musa troglodytarum]
MPPLSSRFPPGRGGSRELFLPPWIESSVAVSSSVVRLSRSAHGSSPRSAAEVPLAVAAFREERGIRPQAAAAAARRQPRPGADSKRDLSKRVISYMTVGIEVSAAFSEMVMCSATSDIVLTKMCYIYVGNYARCHPDLALLTINFLQKDCHDEDPMIRGLALRSLCSLRVPNLVEYLVAPLGAGLKDGSSYVRMVAAVGVLKLHHISAATCLDSDFPAVLKSLMLTDPDAQVVANCLFVLQEIWNLEANKSEEAARERETLLSKKIYIPSDTDDIFDIMNLLEDRLQHANGAVVLATIKVYERIKAPLLTLVGSGSSEQSYAVLSHLHLLFSDPSYVKKLKLEMLTAIANESNTYEIVTELCEYAGNVDESIRAVGKIALQQYDVNAIVDRLLQFLEMEKDYVTAETLQQKRSRTKSKSSTDMDVGRVLPRHARCPYILESLIENWDEENAAEVRLHLLTAAMKCFFKRPPETQKALGAALAAGLADSHQDVHDRALFYHRLLQYDVSVAEHVVNPPKQAVSVFADTQSSEIKDRIFDEFNSLSVVYQKPSYMFTDKEHREPFEFSEEIGNLSLGQESVGNAPRYDESDKDLLLSTSEREENGGPSTNGPAASGYSAPTDYNSSLVSLSSQTQSETAISDPGMPKYTSQMTLAIDDLLGLSVSAAPAPPSLKLNPKAALDPGTFQRKWGQLAVSISQDCSVSPQGVAALTTPQALIRHMQTSSIQCIASGGQSPNFKFFFFAQKLDGPPSFFLVECLVNTSSAKAQVKIKADDATASEVFFGLFQSALSKFGVL